MKTHKSLPESERPTSYRLYRRWLWMVTATVLGAMALLALTLEHLSHQTMQTVAQRLESPAASPVLFVILWIWGSASLIIVALGISLTRAWQRIEKEQLHATASSRRYQTLFLQAPDAIFDAAPDGQIIAANPASCAMFGWTEPELQAMGRSGLVDPSDPRVEAALNERKRTGLFRGELRFVRKGGETFEGELFSSVFVDQDGQPRATVIVRDATERHRYQNALRESTLKLQVLSRRIINAQEAERRRVANELHDELGQSLTAIKINLESGARFKNRSPEEINQENIRIVEEVLQQVRSLALALRPAILDNLGLGPALGWLGKQMAQRSGFEFEFLPLTTPHRLPPELETTCFRIVQEALTNVVRHAKASQVTLSMQMDGDALTIQLIDNGVGLDWTAVRQAAQNGNSAGVLGMLERASLVGGSLDMESAPGEGCTLTLKCPLHIQPETE
jgi:PAS domain S-box-containing protein